MRPVGKFKSHYQAAQRRFIHPGAGDGIEMEIFILTIRTTLRQMPHRADFPAAPPAETVNKAKTYLRPAVGTEIFIVLGNNRIAASAVIMPEKLLQIF